MAAFASLFSPVCKLALMGALLAGLGGGASTSWARDVREIRSDDRIERVESSVALRDLPTQGRRTYQVILEGGPFRYEKDGSVFGNRERLLPRERRGHYREYTVDTPGSRNRGTRRIVCGGPPRTPEACWYTADHYASFKRIMP
ncbi:MAG: guanine-specific ribonuclease N1 and T1 [Comamonadaceae bacterium]|nr:MAG: guanine-specific ribonuclease N1 and T1 [Comamonadaceae bacterium]